MKSSDLKARNPFENDNARNSSPENLSQQFVWTKTFERLLNAKNHVVIGARGSGKTALVKMLSHEYLSRCDHESAKKIIKRRGFIGTCIPMRLSWVGGLKSDANTDEQYRERQFQWRLNMTCCAAFITTIESCIHQYAQTEFEKIVVEKKISLDLSLSWCPASAATSLSELREILADIEYRRTIEEEKSRVLDVQGAASEIGIEFGIALFEPVKRAISILKKYIKFPSNTIWALCLDEAEFLSLEYQRILNSHMRTYADGVVFKITTMPYKHYTLRTNTAAPLVAGDDFDYIYLDNLERAKKTNQEYEKLKEFCQNLFERRLKGSAWQGTGVSLEALLSTSYILSDKNIDQNKIFSLVSKHTTTKTIARAEYLLGSTKFDDEIGRKLKGALLLREAASKLKGNASSTIYSGIEMVIRCADGNPRRFLGLMNSLYLAGNPDHGFHPIPEQVQDRILRAFSHNEFRRIISEPASGEDMHSILYKIGIYFKDCLHYQPLSSDLTLSFRYNIHDDKVWSILSEAIGLGLIRPIKEKSQHTDFPDRQGTFRLSYMLSPHFMLLPRRGSSVSLSTILKDTRSTAGTALQMDLI